MSARTRFGLPLAAFCAGWGLMMLEILGGRLMAPLYGYSVYQWGAIIGVVLAFMAAGYWKGGAVGDTAAAVPFLRAALAASAVWAAATPRVGPALLTGTSAGMGPEAGSVVGAVLLLGLPSFALATVSPIGAGLSGTGGVAARAGRIYAVSTLGSIGGTFFAAFYAIPAIGVSAGYAVAAAVLALGCAAVPGGLRAGAAVAVVAAAAWIAEPARGRDVAVYRETPHNTIYVREDADEVRLHLNVLWAVQSRLRRDGGPTGSYYDLFTAGPALADGRRVLVLGLAGGVAATQIAAAWPDAAVVGVELDPAVVEVARDHFALDGVEVVVGDARRYVDRSSALYDVIIVDLYATAIIPFFTATREFFAAVERRLAPGGVVMMNVAAPADRDALVGPLAATMAAVFPAVFTADAGRGNHLVIATKDDRTPAAVRVRLEAAPPAALYAARRLADTLDAADPAGHPVLTDDRSDIDLRSLRALYGSR
ncbi:fused MFS/spermidine synthase [Azospirillum halopraeferens]|uniref:fused MFS/spermidine synthase n=1 Tax=Azospirillum halopraeferens TaxID=34010 RepID=UPI0004178198|nr:fused MFS/spermidine synthase [Azospirillum halopraeferens]